MKSMRKRPPGKARWKRLLLGLLKFCLVASLILGPMALGAVYVTFFVGLSVGIVAVLFVILFSLGLISLRASLLANPLPAAKKFAK